MLYFLVFVIGVLVGALFVWAVHMERDAQSEVDWTIGEDE